MAHVLVVDDDAGIRAILVQILAGVGHEVREAEGGVAALQSVDAHTPDVVCLDLWMDDMSGLEVLDQLAKTHPGLPVVVVTADPLTDTMETARAHGAFDYVLKPFDAARIQRVVDEAVARPPRPRPG